MNGEVPMDPGWPPEMNFTARQRNEEDRLYLLDLIRVLKAHPAGLRRWSVMRGIREYRKAAGLPIEQRMEDAVERLFRNHCADPEKSKKRNVAPDAALFYWPQGRQGGIWAVVPERPKHG